MYDQFCLGPGCRQCVSCPMWSECHETEEAETTPADGVSCICTPWELLHEPFHRCPVHGSKQSLEVT